MQILKGHISPETAYVVEDYPYGFRLRCKIRYWIEYKPKKGFRFVSQTTNPKKPSEVWNKPKASTYSAFGGALYLDERNHVYFSGLTEYTDAEEAKNWSRLYREGVPEAGLEVHDFWLRAKEAYEKKKEIAI